MSEGCPRECGSQCCRYVTVEIDSPVKGKVNRDEARWFLMHGDVSVMREGRHWYLQIDARCQNLSAGGLCAIYEERPDVCRDYSTKGCDYHGKADDKHLFIATVDEWDRYLEERKRKKQQKKERKKDKKRKKGRK